jgi:hypothetical protein
MLPLVGVIRRSTAHRREATWCLLVPPGAWRGLRKYPRCQFSSRTEARWGLLLIVSVLGRQVRTHPTIYPSCEMLAPGGSR